MKHNSGFSLLELIFVIAMLSIGILGVVRAFSFSSQMNGLARDYSAAVLIEQQRFQRLELAEKQGILSKVLNSSTEDVGKYTYSYEIAPVPDSALDLLDMNVTWRVNSKENKLSFKTYLRT